MKLKFQFVFQPLGKTYMGVPVGESSKSFHGMLQLNEVGYDIVSMMKEDISREEMADKLQELYETDSDTAFAYVDQVVEYLRDEGVVRD